MAKNKNTGGGVRRISDVVRAAQRRIEALQKKGAEGKAKRQTGPAARGQQARKVASAQGNLKRFLNRQGVKGLARKPAPVTQSRTSRRGGRTVAKPGAFQPR